MSSRTVLAVPVEELSWSLGAMVTETSREDELVRAVNGNAVPSPRTRIYESKWAVRSFVFALVRTSTSSGCTTPSRVLLRAENCCASRTFEPSHRTGRHRQAVSHDTPHATDSQRNNMTFRSLQEGSEMYTNHHTKGHVTSRAQGTRVRHRRPWGPLLESASHSHRGQVCRRPRS